MLEELVVITEDRPGVLAEIGELLGRAGVNIETLAASNALGQGIVHIVVDDGDDAAEVLKANGFKVDSVRDVLTTTIEDQPGELGRYCKKLHDAGVEITAAYVSRRGSGDTELIFAVDDIAAARSV